MTEFRDIGGQTHETECVACAIQRGDVVLPVRRIAETHGFVVEQDSECPIEGFLVIVSKRHVFGFDELSDDEIVELGRLIKSTRTAMRRVLGISEVTLVQEEMTKTSHFHLWMFPWHHWMNGRWHGRIQEIEEIMQYSRVELTDQTHLNNVRIAAEMMGESLARCS